MPASHTVVQGEHVSRIAANYGFRNFLTIWDHPKNAKLKNQRINPNVLNPGDVLYIPDKLLKVETRPTAQVHTFVLPIPKLKLRIAVYDFDNKPVPNAKCELEIGGAKYLLTTDSRGRIEQSIASTDEDGVLRIPDLDYERPVKIGHLDPTEEDLGWKQRLINLGYHAEALDTDQPAKLHEAVEEFQCDFQIKVTGELDAATRAKLKEVHGC